MKSFIKRATPECQAPNGDGSGRVVRLRRFGFRLFALPRPRLSFERVRQQGWIRLSPE